MGGYKKNNSVFCSIRLKYTQLHLVGEKETMLTAVAGGAHEYQLLAVN